MKSSPWWKEATIYQIYPRSFFDSNGDGEGDLPGITSKLEYVKALGVDAIWLSPFYTSPNKDGGYDVADPRDVDPRFGNLADAKKMIEVAHSLDLRVLVDVVPNHFSDQHVWFQAALKAGRGSVERRIVAWVGALSVVILRAYFVWCSNFRKQHVNPMPQWLLSIFPWLQFCGLRPEQVIAMWNTKHWRIRPEHR